MTNKFGDHLDWIHSHWLSNYDCISDPYVKLLLLHNGQRIAKKRKTNVKKRTLNPEFNETFVFDLPYSQEDMKNVELDFIVFDWDRLSKNEVWSL